METAISYFKTIQILVLLSALGFALYLSCVLIQAGLNLYLKRKEKCSGKRNCKL